MSNKNKVIVKILGQEYTIVSDEPREYMQKVSNYVDDIMGEIAEKNKKLSTAMIAVLTALNVADEYYKIKDSTKDLERKIVKPLDELETTKEQLAVATTERNERNREYETMVYEYEKLKEDSEKFLDEYKELEENINRLSYELNLKENKLNKSNKIIEDLKNKLVQREVKLVQTKKELQEFIEIFDNASSK